MCSFFKPRRISAITIAERVAEERCEMLGNSVGYSVRFDSVFPRPYAGMLYCTVGECKRKLITSVLIWVGWCRRDVSTVWSDVPGIFDLKVLEEKLKSDFSVWILFQIFPFLLVIPFRALHLHVWNKMQPCAYWLKEVNSSRPSDAYMRQYTNHHWFR